MYITKKKFKRKKRIRIFYYLVKNRIVNKQPRMMHVKYLGTAERILKVFETYEKHNKEE